MNILLSIQLIAFVFGAYSLFLKHPAYAVFSVDRFVLTNVSNIYPRPSWSKQLKYYFFSSPEFVVAHFPKDSKEKNALTLDVILNGQPDIDNRPKYYMPFDQHIDSVMSKSIQLEQLALDSQAKEKLSIFKKNHESKYGDFTFFPLSGNNKKDMIWVFDKTTGKPIEIIDIDPWNKKIALIPNKIGFN